ncbi:HAMP domain-containing sensor histidine kinase [Devosia sp.]|uniref:HAMP domain-containing sensor histidine kinase n=1 Tax=Devosia sp. TaxID=1871048 RepID=UPI001AD305E1|nr:HAMP domain-containing sensor histidine kinase [Devosia sp.]MBN9309744.1 HAMP domain-containing histidine kinase [Devosia sp.]
MGSILAGAAFRSAWLSLLLFLAVFFIAGLVVVSQTRSEAESEIRALISNEFQLFREASANGGDSQLQDLVDESARFAGPRDFVVAYYSADATLLAGDAIPLPAPVGWSTITTAPPGAAPEQYLALTERIGANLVTFGRTLRFVQVGSDALWRALMLASVVVGIGALGIGYLMSHGVSAKLDRMAATLERVARGESRVRLPVGRSNDQVDRVAVQMNAHLDRLSDLLDTMRNTIISIAHDLKSPLNRAYILLQEAADERGRQGRARLIEEAQGEIERLNGIFDTVLRISRIEASDDQSGFVPFSANKLVGEILQTFEPVIEESRQTLVAHESADDVTIVGDRRMVVQMLVNLITNASRYSPAGARIEVAAGMDDHHPVLVVADNGPGIAEHQRKAVFEPFRRLNPERDEKGSGLGLALVQAIATRHRATVELENNDPGLRVVVRFPPPPPPKLEHL